MTTPPPNLAPPAANPAAATIAQALREYGTAIAGDWSSIDGRSIDGGLDTIARAVLGEAEASWDIARWRTELRICPDGGGHWAGRWYGYCETDDGCPSLREESPAGSTEATGRPTLTPGTHVTVTLAGATIDNGRPYAPHLSYQGFARYSQVGDRLYLLPDEAYADEGEQWLVFGPLLPEWAVPVPAPQRDLAAGYAYDPDLGELLLRVGGTGWTVRPR